MNEPTSTADYRKYPKGPNFLLIVILAGVAILLVLAASYLLLTEDGRKLLPRLHQSHPTSMVIQAPPTTIAA